MDEIHAQVSYDVKPEFGRFAEAKYNALLKVFYVYLVKILFISVAGGENFSVTVCPHVAGSDGESIFPSTCPRAGDADDRIRCCRINGFTPACCQERAAVVCVRKEFKGNPVYTAFDTDPGASYEVRAYCPQPDDPDTFTECSPHGGTACKPPHKQTDSTIKVFYALLLLLPGLFIVLMVAIRKVFTHGNAGCTFRKKDASQNAAKEETKTMNNHVTLQHCTPVMPELNSDYRYVPIQRYPSNHHGPQANVDREICNQNQCEIGEILTAPCHSELGASNKAT